MHRCIHAYLVPWMRIELALTYSETSNMKVSEGLIVLSYYQTL